MNFQDKGSIGLREILCVRVRSISHVLTKTAFNRHPVKSPFAHGGP
jgi:hypothetical protein